MTLLLFDIFYHVYPNINLSKIRRKCNYFPNTPKLKYLKLFQIILECFTFLKINICVKLVVYKKTCVEGGGGNSKNKSDSYFASKSKQVSIDSAHHVFFMFLFV